MNDRSEPVGVSPEFLRWVAPLGAAILLILTLSLPACDVLEDDDEAGVVDATGDAPLAEESAVKPVVPATVSVPAFDDPPGVAGAQWEDRMPADAGRTILVPATTLFPGSAWVDPDVENPYSGEAEAIAAGKRHFAAYNCAGCHAPLGGGGMGPPLSDDAWIYGGEPAQIYLSIMHGRGNGMPAWASMLPRKTTWELVAYIETLDEIDNYARAAGFDERSPPGNRPPEGAPGSETTEEK